MKTINDVNHVDDLENGEQAKADRLYGIRPMNGERIARVKVSHLTRRGDTLMAVCSDGKERPITGKGNFILVG